MVFIVLSPSPLANTLGVKPSSSTISKTFFLVFSLTLGLLLMTLETVAIETFALFAISYIFIILQDRTVKSVKV